jgi:hypothetical protein
MAIPMKDSTDIQPECAPPQGGVFDLQICASPSPSRRGVGVR